MNKEILTFESLGLTPETLPMMRLAARMAEPAAHYPGPVMHRARSRGKLRERVSIPAAALAQYLTRAGLRLERW